MSDIPILGDLKLPAWTAFTPVLTGSTTNPTLGTGGTQTGRYIRLGSLVFFVFRVQFGTSGAAAGSGEYRISLPVTAHADSKVLGTGSLIQSSTSLVRGVNLMGYGATLGMDQTDAAANQHWVRNTVPWTWAASDYMQGSGHYEAA